MMADVVARAAIATNCITSGWPDAAEHVPFNSEVRTGGHPMTLYELSVTALRLMAVWMLCNLLLDAVALAAAVARMSVSLALPIAGQNWGLLGATLPSLIVNAGLIALFVYFAPRIARFVCGEVRGDSEQIQMTSVSAGDIYCIGSFLLGVSVMLSAVSPAVNAVTNLMVRGMSAAHSQDTVVLIVEALIFVFCGGALAAGSRGMSMFLTSLGYSADQTPTQRFSIRLVLAIVFACALALGIMRALL